jgi:biopolymer transport protein ExbD
MTSRRDFDLSDQNGPSLRRRRESVRPDLLPLLDVIFLLVAVLMFSLVRMVRAWSLPLELPTAASGVESAPAEVLLLSIDSRGQYHCQGKPLAADEVVALALERSADSVDLRVLIEADRFSPYGEVFGLLDGLKLAGIEQVFLIGEPGQGGD